MELEDLAAFMDWLRRPAGLRQPGVFVLPGRPSALESSTLVRKRAALGEFYRFHAVRGSARPVLGGLTPGTRRATGDYVPMLAHAMSGPVERSPLRIHIRSKRPHTLTDDQVSQLQEACRRLRDRFLVTLLYESGLRISEALGLRHADLDPASCAVHVVAREDNPNHARVKGMMDRAVPVRDYLFNRYAEPLASPTRLGTRCGTPTPPGCCAAASRSRSSRNCSDTPHSRPPSPPYAHLDLADYRRVLAEHGVLDGEPIA